MTYKIFGGTIAIAVLSFAIYDVVWAQTSGQLEHEGSLIPVMIDRASEQTLEVRAEEKTVIFIEELEAVDLGILLLSAEANRLAGAFREVVVAIHAIEESRSFEQAEPYRIAIENAIEKHMERPGALRAPISGNINAYSRYLTETLIAQANEHAEISNMN